LPLSARSGERDNPACRFATGPEGFDRRAIERVVPTAKRWEGEVCLQGTYASAIDTHLTRSLRERPLPPQAGGEGYNVG
jgi:hypothetical protein